MVNTHLFQTVKGAFLPAATARNAQHAPAYAFSARHQLAQLAATGCLSHTFYASADDQLDLVIALTQQLDPAFVAKAAIYGRQHGYMKDMPALLAASLAVRDVALLSQVFSRVVDSGKMLRNFVQILRSGSTGRKSLGSRPKKLVQHWLLTATEKQLLNAAVGNTPSLADVVKMVHPKPAEAWRAAWFAWLIGKPVDEAALPPITQAFERFKRECAEGVATDLPDVPFQMLTALALNASQWAQIARAGSWQMVRQNLNTFARHGVFDLPGMADAVAAKLSDEQAVARARVLPYQLLSAYVAAGEAVPFQVRDALQSAMELSLANVPALAGRVVVCPDVSGSMGSSVTGYRGSATSSVRCIDVAALVAAAVLRKNPQASVLPFEQEVVKLSLNARDSVMTNAQALAKIGGGGTNCSAPLALLNRQRAEVDLVILVSDNESWLDANRRGATQTLREWEALKQRNPNARLVCIDIQPTATTQAAERHDIMNVGGFSDAVFTMLANFASGKMDADHWVGEIEKVSLAVQ
ncbi:TROVE domain-containing protein [Xylophilus sp. Leaf220]|uniref:TROVE domain-containing protein n=1 Tax=Xylophilus sp. Leaf220 TaxID=1735686 RepID=UPI0006F8B239|nr:TROVE domain-containing protein [Xylophilus sp. Leaf220]KQM75220.1 RNA-binding protein [Xylophilus sp. Leaf220]